MKTGNRTENEPKGTIQNTGSGYDPATVIDNIIKYKGFPMHQLEFYPVIRFEDIATDKLGKYLKDYRDGLMDAIAEDAVPVVSTQPGLGFQTHTQEILTKQFDAGIVLTIELKNIISTDEVTELIQNFANMAAAGKSKHKGSPFIILNDIASAQSGIMFEALETVYKHHDKIRFLISVYKEK